MTSGLQITINLVSGRSVKRSMPRSVIGPGETPKWTVTERLLSAKELTSLRRVINQSLDEGLKSKTCNDEDQIVRKRGGVPPPRPPVADSLIDLHVQLDGRHASAPERNCTSAAFDALWTAAYTAADARSR